MKKVAAAIIVLLVGYLLAGCGAFLYGGPYYETYTVYGSWYPAYQVYIYPAPPPYPRYYAYPYRFHYYGRHYRYHR